MLERDKEKSMALDKLVDSSQLDANLTSVPDSLFRGGAAPAPDAGEEVTS